MGSVSSQVFAAEDGGTGQTRAGRATAGIPIMDGRGTRRFCDCERGGAGWESDAGGGTGTPFQVAAFSLIFRRRSFSGSLIGGIRETQEMLDFCGKHDITSDVEVIPIQKVNEAYERMVKSDVKYRFSIDMGSLKG
jgi:hypothetical protein